MCFRLRRVRQTDETEIGEAAVEANVEERGQASSEEVSQAASQHWVKQALQTRKPMRSAEERVIDQHSQLPPGPNTPPCEDRRHTTRYPGFLRACGLHMSTPLVTGTCLGYWCGLGISTAGTPHRLYTTTFWAPPGFGYCHDLSYTTTWALPRLGHCFDVDTSTAWSP